MAWAPSQLCLPHHWQQQGPHKRGLYQESGYLHSICERLIEEHPEGGTGPIDHRGMPTKVVLQQKNRYCESET